MGYHNFGKFDTNDLIFKEILQCSRILEKGKILLIFAELAGGRYTSRTSEKGAKEYDQKGGGRRKGGQGQTQRTS